MADYLPPAAEQPDWGPALALTSVPSSWDMKGPADVSGEGNRSFSGQNANPPLPRTRLDGRTPRLASAVHRVRDRKSGEKRTQNILLFVQIKGAVFRATVFNRTPKTTPRTTARCHHRTTEEDALCSCPAEELNSPFLQILVTLPGAILLIFPKRCNRLIISGKL